MMRAGAVSFALLLCACTSEHNPAKRSDAACDEPRVDLEGRSIFLAGSGPLEVFVGDGTTPIAGGIQRDGDGRAFFPAFPFAAGVRYRFRGNRCEGMFALPDAPHRAPEVVAVYPRADPLPENILRFYIQFSEPMFDGDFLRHLRLENVTTGEDLTGVFFDNQHELWSHDRRRITLLVDPGRVKTGLAANRERGRAFRAGDRYRLRVLRSWMSLRRQALAHEHVFEFTAAPEDREAVNPSRWQLALPRVGSRDPLRVRFDEPMDHVAVMRMLSLRTANGEPLGGRWQLDQGGERATWTPCANWPETLQGIVLRVEGRFEDVAGNNINAALDHAVRGAPDSEDQPRFLPLVAT